MASKLFLSFFLLLLLAPCARGAECALQFFSQEEALGSTRLRLDFSAPPSYRVQTSGQRVDLFLEGTGTASTLRLPPEGDRIVRTLLASGRDELMVSFLLRQVPSGVDVRAERGGTSLVLEVFWEPEAASRPAIAFRISGLPTSRAGGAIASPVPASPYEGDWEEFFRRYRVPLTLKIPLFYSLPAPPAFSVPAQSGESVRLLANLASDERWEEVLETLPLLSPPAEPEARQRLEVLRGEALLRTGALAGAQRVLSPLLDADLPAESTEQVVYLFAVAAASAGDPYLARYQLSRIPDPQGPYAPALRLLRGEIALAIERPREALEALGDDELFWPSAVRPLREMRLADALSATGEFAAARERYRRLISHPELLMRHAYSMRRCAEALLAGGEAEQAAFLFEELAKKVPETEGRGLVMVAAALAHEAAGDLPRALTFLNQVRVDQPESEAGWRARLRVIDLEVLSGDELRRRTSEAEYAAVASRANLRSLREEAAFKRALLLHLTGEAEQSVRYLITFGREFAGGPLKGEATILLRRMVPEVTASMVARGDDLQALVLVEQTREEMLAGEVDLSFLLDVARAGVRLGLLQRASRVYLYLLDGPGDPAGKESFYLPLVQLTCDRGEYALSEEFGRRYLERYPRGADRHAVYLLRARALVEQGREEAAAELLRSPDRPRSADLDLLAAELFLRLGDYQGVVGVFEGGKGPGSPQGRILQAEALYRLGRSDRALPLFRALLDEAAVGDQAVYRAAQIELQAGRRQEGLNLLRRLAEKGNDPLWRRLAGETLAAQKL